MITNDLMIIQEGLSWLEEKSNLYFLTVIKTWGSSPRPPGSIAIISDEGDISGSVSGGCIEESLIAHIKQESLFYPQIITYGSNEEHLYHVTLPCNGVLEILVERLNNKTELSNIELALLENRNIVRCTNLETGLSFTNNTHQTKLLSCHNQTYKRLFGPQLQLIIIGANDIAYHLVKITQSLNYQILITEPRIEFSKNWKLNDVKIDSSMPDDVIKKHAHPLTAIVALTHDPRIDDLGLWEALKSEAFYIAVIGSTSNNTKRKERLITLDLTPDELNKLHSPAGIPIGSKTPAEIAVSIAAELTAIKNSTILN